MTSPTAPSPPLDPVRTAAHLPGLDPIERAGTLPPLDPTGAGRYRAYPALDRPMPLVYAGLLAVIAASGVGPAGIVLAMLLAFVGICRAWSAASFRRLHATRTFSHAKVFPGDRFESEFVLRNAKWLPLPWVEIAQALPPAFRPEEENARRGAVAFREGALPQKRVLSLLWKDERRVRIGAIAERRGRYRIEGGSLATGDPFGIYPERRTIRGDSRLTVFPALIPLVDFERSLARRYGPLEVRRHLLADPSIPAGLREWGAGDSLRHVHWKASARRDALQVKVFDSSIDPGATLWLDTRGFDLEGEEPFERAISLTASLAVRLARTGQACGLAVDARFDDGRTSAELEAERGEAQASRMLELLAAIAAPATGPQAGARSPSPNCGATGNLLWIGDRLRTTVLVALQGFARRGYCVTAICLDAPGVDAPGIRVASFEATGASGGRR